MEQIWKDITLDLFNFGVLHFSFANHPACLQWFKSVQKKQRGNFSKYNKPSNKHIFPLVLCLLPRDRQSSRLLIKLLHDWKRMLSHTAIMRVLYIHPTAGFWTGEASEAVKTSCCKCIWLDRYHLCGAGKSCNWWSYTLWDWVMEIRRF